MEGGQFRKYDILWELPALFLPSLEADDSNNLPEGSSFGGWCRSFVRANATKRAALLRDPQLPLEAYLTFLGSHDSDQWGSLASTDANAELARDFYSSGKMLRIVAEELGMAAPLATEKTSRANRDQELSDRYFPRVPKDAVFCVGCASYDHTIDICPWQICRLCGGCEGGHTQFGCPTLSNQHEPVDVTGLSPPRQIEHTSDVQVPAAHSADKMQDSPNDEANGRQTRSPKCPFCLEESDHLGACPLLWRTFVPMPAAKRMASQISASCYFCGRGGHFGGDCEQNTGEHLSGRRYSLRDDIWSCRYALQFVDQLMAGDQDERTALVKTQAPGRATTSTQRKRAKLEKHSAHASNNGTPSQKKGKAKHTQPPKTGQAATNQGAGQSGAKAQIPKSGKGKQPAAQPPAPRVALPARPAPSKGAAKPKAANSTPAPNITPALAMAPHTVAAVTKAAETVAPAQAPAAAAGGNKSKAQTKQAARRARRGLRSEDGKKWAARKAAAETQGDTIRDGAEQARPNRSKRHIRGKKIGDVRDHGPVDGAAGRGGDAVLQGPMPHVTPLV